jgi:invasion protein IalB
MKRTAWAAVAVLLLASAPARAAQTGDAFDAWTARCEGQGVAQTCEIFQRLMQAQSGMRVMEFALGYPKQEEVAANGKKPKVIAPASKAIMTAADIPARGVIVLPLGIMLPDGVRLAIDGKQHFPFEVRYCTADGCYAYINLPGGVVDQMKRAMKVEILFRTLEKKDMRLPVDMKGLGAGLQAVR